jgi:hypothetical protein
VGSSELDVRSNGPPVAVRSNPELQIPNSQRR